MLHFPVKTPSTSSRTHVPRPPAIGSGGEARLPALQRAYGNQAILRAQTGTFTIIQRTPGRTWRSLAHHDAAGAAMSADATRMVVAPPGTAQEREAGEVAARLIAADDPAVARMKQRDPSPHLGRNGAEAGGFRISADQAGLVRDALREGEPLDAATRSWFETRFARDFGAVRVHRGAAAQAAAAALDAAALTLGNNIVFAAGAYAPREVTGRRLLAHELVHTIQQRGSTFRGELEIGRSGDAFEHEAERVATAVISEKVNAASTGGIVEPSAGRTDGAPNPVGVTPARMVGGSAAIRRQRRGRPPTYPVRVRQQAVRIQTQVRRALEREARRHGEREPVRIQLQRDRFWAELYRKSKELHSLPGTTGLATHPAQAVPSDFFAVVQGEDAGVRTEIDAAIDRLMVVRMIMREMARDLPADDYTLYGAAIPLQSYFSVVVISTDQEFLRDFAKTNKLDFLKLDRLSEEFSDMTRFLPKVEPTLEPDGLLKWPSK